MPVKCDMKRRVTLSMILFFSAFVFLCSCNSESYDKEEESVEAPKTETKTEIKEDVEQPKNEIKQEINKDISKKDLKVSPRTYTIQLGAFSNESNAKDFLSYAQSKLDYSINYYQIEGLYKVRVGSFNNVSDARAVLVKVRDVGFADSFMTDSK